MLSSDFTQKIQTCETMLINYTPLTQNTIIVPVIFGIIPTYSYTTVRAITIDYRYIAVTYNKISHAEYLTRRLIFCQVRILRKRHPYLAQTGKLWLSFVNNSEKIDWDISGAHCISQYMLFHLIFIFLRIDQVHNLSTKFIGDIYLNSNVTILQIYVTHDKGDGLLFFFKSQNMLRMLPHDIYSFVDNVITISWDVDLSLD